MNDAVHLIQFRKDFCDFGLDGDIRDGLILLFLWSFYSAYQNKGNPYSKAHCSKVKWFENLHVAYRWRATHPLSIGTFLASGMSRMTEYIAIEDDNVMTHFLQVLTIG